MKYGRTWYCFPPLYWLCILWHFINSSATDFLLSSGQDHSNSQRKLPGESFLDCVYLEWLTSQQPGHAVHSTFFVSVVPNLFCLWHAAVRQYFHPCVLPFLSRGCPASITKEPCHCIHSGNIALLYYPTVFIQCLAETKCQSQAIRLFPILFTLSDSKSRLIVSTIT